MHSSLKSGSIFFNLVGLFLLIVVLFVILTSVSVAVANGSYPTNYIEMLLVLVIPFSNFLIGWGYKNGKYWAWYLSVFEIFGVVLLGAYILFSGELVGLIYISIGITVGSYLYKLQKYFMAKNA